MHATAIAHPNIALVKYWGKANTDANLPAVGSISITLDTLQTTTTVDFDARFTEDRLILDGRDSADRLGRVQACLDLFGERLGSRPFARVTSRNNFPTAAGLASSASGFAALVVAADRALGAALDRDTLAELARRCSGSAARSIFGGFVELAVDHGAGTTSTGRILGSGDWPLRVVIAVTSLAEKKVGSTEGMKLTEQSSPFYRAWVDTSEHDLGRARQAIARQDFEALAEVSEQSCLKMHAVAMAANPGLLYWNGTTVECMHRIRALRRQGCGVFFTVDAGPQVKAVCLPGDEDRVASMLEDVPGVVEILRCGLGEAARVVTDSG